MDARRTRATALVMTAGGARAAYQAGVLKRIGEIEALRNAPSPFGILEGASAGAINGTAIAVGAEDFPQCTARLAEMWQTLQPYDVYRTDLISLLENALRWLRDLVLGGVLQGGHARFVLDARPLADLLNRHIDFSAIQRNVDRGLVRALAVVATDYASGRTFVFVQGEKGHPCWVKTRRVAIATPITVGHLRASTAIPVLFEPIQLMTPYGPSWFGDGCLRLPSPLGTAIRLGADRILAIGLRHRPAPGEAVDNPLSTGPVSQLDRPPLAQIVGVSLSALFLDQMDSDIEHLERINRLIASGTLGATSHGNESMRPVRTLIVTPSKDLGALAELHFHDMPAQVRYLMGGLGVKNTSNAELISYVLFAPSYLRALVDEGYRDAEERIEEIEAFLT